MPKKPAPAPMQADRYATDLARKLERISYDNHRDAADGFRSFVRRCACAVSAGQREPEYMEEIRLWGTESAQAFADLFCELAAAMEANPYRDLLGDLHMEMGSKSSRDATGEFYTPHEVCRMMAQMNAHGLEVPPDRPLTGQEPACGSGRMVLAWAEVLVGRGLLPLNMAWTCIDVNRTACDVCFVNLTLWGIPATVVHGNTLTLETWGEWRNPLWPLACGAAPEHPMVAALKLLWDGSLAEVPPVPSQAAAPVEAPPAAPQEPEPPVTAAVALPQVPCEATPFVVLVDPEPAGEANASGQWGLFA